MADIVGGNPAVTMAVYAALTYDVISATNSSPQTTHINAKKRADTLMLWVNIGMGQAILFAGIGIIIEKKLKRPIWPPLLGSGLASVLLYGQYIMAKQWGLQEADQPGTEDY
jgi:hypothetical protein